jgi:hypothetical protein
MGFGLTFSTFDGGCAEQFGTDSSLEHQKASSGHGETLSIQTRDFHQGGTRFFALPPVPALDAGEPNSGISLDEDTLVG